MQYTNLELLHLKLQVEVPAMKDRECSEATLWHLGILMRSISWSEDVGSVYSVITVMLSAVLTANRTGLNLSTLLFVLLRRNKVGRAV